MKRLSIALALALMLVWGTAALAQTQEEPAFTPYTRIVDGAFVKPIVDQKEIGLVVDSRPKVKKYDVGHIPGAVNLPFTQFEKVQGLLPADKNALIVFYCDGLKCALSHKSAYAAEKMGYKNVAVYAAGYPDWKKAYGPGPGDPDLAPAAASTSSKAPAQTGLYKPGKMEGAIDPDVFKDLVKNGKDSVLLVDNRGADEFAKGSIPGAVSIPTEDLEKKLADWKPEKPVVFFCGTGARSGEAYYMVKDKRPDIKEVYYVDAEMTFDAKGEFTIKPAI